MVAFTSAQETNLSVAARKITAFSSLGFRELERRQALDLQCFTKALFLTKNQSKFHLLTTPEVELLVSALKPDDAAYNLYVGMVTFQPGSGRWISELHSVELQTGR